MRDTPRLRAALFATLLLAAGACTGDDAAPAPDAGPEEGVVLEDAPVPEVRVTPAESAAAAQRIRGHAGAMRREARVRAGLPAEDDPPPARAEAAPTAAAEYEGCMAQARVAEGHTRALIERGCENRRQSRAADAP